MSKTTQKNIKKPDLESDLKSDDTIQNMTPKEVVKLLNSHVIGQEKAKKAVAIALRDRWRRMQLHDDLRDEVGFELWFDLDLDFNFGVNFGVNFGSISDLSFFISKCLSAVTSLIEICNLLSNISVFLETSLL